MFQMTLQEIVREETEWMFGDIGEGQGIGSSDISACIDNVLDHCIKVVVLCSLMKVKVTGIRWMISDVLLVKWKRV